MTSVEDRIVHSINWIVDQEIQQEDLKETLKKYVAAQSAKGFPFAELTILHYQMLNGSELGEVIPVAAAIELLVLSFDILDDVEDGDDDLKLWMQEPSVALNASTAMIFYAYMSLENQNCRIKKKPYLSSWITRYLPLMGSIWIFWAIAAQNRIILK